MDRRRQTDQIDRADLRHGRRDADDSHQIPVTVDKPAVTSRHKATEHSLRMHWGALSEADGTVIDVLKVAVFVLVVQLVLLGLTLGMPMAGTSMCPDDDVTPV
jgi:hypothetical protein